MSSAAACGRGAFATSACVKAAFKRLGAWWLCLPWGRADCACRSASRARGLWGLYLRGAAVAVGGRHVASCVGDPCGVGGDERRQVSTREEHASRERGG